VKSVDDFVWLRLRRAMTFVVKKSFPHQIQFLIIHLKSLFASLHRLRHLRFIPLFKSDLTCIIPLAFTKLLLFKKAF